MKILQVWEFSDASVEYPTGVGPAVCVTAHRQHCSHLNPCAGFSWLLAAGGFLCRHLQKTYCVMMKIEQCYLLCVERGWLNRE